MTQRLQDFEIAGLDGSPDALAGTAGKVILVVNVASRCGYTPQYADLVALQEEVASEGFSVVGVPCNQFGGQEPGTSDEIAEFCQVNYGVTFPITEKVDVNGDDRHPLYAALVDVADAEGHTGDIRWNFEKFLVGPDGTVVARFGPRTTPDAPELVEAVEKHLPA